MTNSINGYRTKFGAHGEVTMHQGKIHEYLGMEVDYSLKGKVNIGMMEYVGNMLKYFPEKIKSTDTEIYSMKAKERSSIKNVQMHTTQWLQKS
jgi:hypothetical protein